MNVICVYGISVFTLQSVSLIHTQVNIGSKQRKRNGLFSYIAGTLKYLVWQYARLFFLPSLFALFHVINEKFAPQFTFFHVINNKSDHSARLFHPAFLFNTSYLRVEAMQWYTVNNYSPL